MSDHQNKKYFKKKDIYYHVFDAYKHKGHIKSLYMCT